MHSDNIDYTKIWRTALICATIFFCFAVGSCQLTEMAGYANGLCRQQKVGSIETFMGACK